MEEVYVIVNGEKQLMTRGKTDTYFDYYEIVLPASKERLDYYFEIHVNDSCLYYDRMGTVKEVKDEYQCSIVKNFSTP